MMRAAFELKVWHKDDESCFFLLLWHDRKKQLTASLNGSQEIQRSYRRWQQRYARFYLPSPQSISDSGRLNPGSGDPGHDLMEAEAELINAFQRWLGEGETRKIQQRIRDELMRLNQPAIAPGKATRVPNGIDLFLACDSPEMARLPWESWELAPDDAPAGTVRIIRTAMDRDEATPQRTPTRPRKARILAILGEDPNLSLHDHWKALRSLRSMAEVNRVTWLPDEDVVAIKTRIASALDDARGWDVLFFAGHSDETSVTGGRFAIAPNVSFSISELEEHLAEAKERGLRLAIFNSCSGLSIAHSLIDLGVQVVAMREPIRNDVAQSFLKSLCQQLSQHHDILDAMISTRESLQATEKFAFPSAYLLPSFFSPANAVPYRIEPFGWQRQVQQWLPSRGEAIALGSLLLIGFLVPVQETLLNLRTAAEAVYRDRTNQLPQNQSPPVLLISVDQESINQASARMEKFQIKPIDRRFLARLVEQISASGINTIGIDYILDRQQPGEEKLANALQSVVNNHNTWVVIGVREPDQLWVRGNVASPNWSLQGDVYSYYWSLEVPSEPTCQSLCPFAYLLSLGALLNQQPALSTVHQSTIPQPRLSSQVDFQQEVSAYLKQQRQRGQKAIAAFLQRATPPLGLDIMLDVSLPPTLAYRRVSAWNFLSNPDLRQQLKSQVAIVAAGGYVDVAEDNFPTPMAMSYWCHSHPSPMQATKGCSEWMTGGEFHAYMVHHWLTAHQVVRIPDWWMVAIAALFGKGLTLILLKQSTDQRRKSIWILAGATAVTGLLELQAYITASVLIPWFLPSVTVWTYVLLALKRSSFRQV